MAISVMLVDDHPLMLRGLQALFSNCEQAEVVAQTGDAGEVPDLVKQLRPEVLVLDIMLPGRSGFEVLATLVRESVLPRVVILSVMHEGAYVRRALGLGAMGYVLKNAAATELLEAVLCVARGEIYLGSGISATGYPALADGRTMLDNDPLNSLTRREMQVLRLVADGLTNNQVAERLDIGVRTVESHRANVMRKLNLRTHRDLIRLAIARNLTDL